MERIYGKSLTDSWFTKFKKGNYLTVLVHSYLAFDVFLDKMVLTLVVNYHMNLFCAVSTNVRPCVHRPHYDMIIYHDYKRRTSFRTAQSQMEKHHVLVSGFSVSPRLTKHDVILGVSMHVTLVKLIGEELDVTTSTVYLLLMLDSELDDQGLSLIAKWLKVDWQGIKVGILAGPDT